MGVDELPPTKVFALWGQGPPRAAPRGHTNAALSLVAPVRPRKESEKKIWLL